MAENKTAKAGSKKATAKSAAKPLRAKSSKLSEAVVVDSDDEGNEVPVQTAPAKLTKLAKNPLKPRAAIKGKHGAAPEAKSKAAPGAPAESIKSAPPAASLKTAVQDSSTSEEDSSSGSEEKLSDEEEKVRQKPEPKKPAAAPSQINGVKRKASEAEHQSDESSEDSSDSDESDSETKRQAKRAKTSAQNEEDNSSESDVTGEEAGKQAERAPPGGSVAQPPAVQRKPYVPPPGYILSSDLPTNTAIESATRHLGQKQIWHITAPASVPIQSVTEATMDVMQGQDTILSYKGTDYVLKEEKLLETGSVAVGFPAGHGIKFSSHGIQKTLHLQQKVDLPNLSKRQASDNTGSAAAGEISQASISSVRPQPKGLRMRYRPPGFGSGKLGMIGSDDDSEEDPQNLASQKSQAFQFPKVLGAHGAATSTDAGPVTEAKAAEKMKKKKRKHDGDAATSQANVPSVQPPAKKVRETLPEMHPNSLLRSSAPEERMSKEEKVKRKEMKRLKREAKRKANEA